VEDEDMVPVVLCLPLEQLSCYLPEPDHPGLDEPLTHTLGMKENEVWEQWEDSQKTWQECVEIIGSLRCRSPIPADILRQFNPDKIAAPIIRSPRP
jgi:hypothetical protein